MTNETAITAEALEAARAFVDDYAMLRLPRGSFERAYQVREKIDAATVAADKSQSESSDAEFARGYDEGQEAIWDEPVCSICGRNHDRDESAMCKDGVVVSFRQWVVWAGMRMSGNEESSDAGAGS